MRLSALPRLLLLAVTLMFLPLAALSQGAPPSALAVANARLAAGDARGALVILDRLVSADPRNPAYRLALARVLLAVGQPTRARYHLVQARGSPHVSATERAQLGDAILKLDTSRDHEAFLRFAIVPESNPGQQTSAGTVTIGGADWTLSSDARAAADTGLHVAAGYARLPQIAPGLRLRFGIDIDGRFYRNSALNDVRLRGQAGLEGLTRGGLVWGTRFSLQERRVANKPYAQGLGVEGDVSWLTAAGGQVRLGFDVNRWNYRTNPALDGTRLGASVQWTRPLRTDLLLRGALFASFNDARAGWASERGGGAVIGVQKFFAGGLVLGLDARYLHNARRGTDPLFGVTRRDDRFGATARILHRSISIKGFAPQLELTLERQTSNIPLYSFTNRRISLGLSREF